MSLRSERREFKTLQKRFDKLCPWLLPAVYESDAASSSPESIPPISVGFHLLPIAVVHLWKREGHWRTSLMVDVGDAEDHILTTVVIGPPTDNDPAPVVLRRAMNYYTKWDQEHPYDVNADSISLDRFRVNDMLLQIPALGINLIP
ncbi:hypothetical protein [Herbiconiux sp. VKM Ac-2851]|uniref:hypothetical protein n=1 Tax=Herbiconiux sp. VKM Ac-2851 TaxID=2739025 RepID=UPI0015669CEE|nr:hypothetical protein [Herbiconiux sp. VKM Ac-2851]NQX33586.1 hypothetical protein [Herbiconiux sp. VKM Ac-2851]